MISLIGQFMVNNYLSTLEFMMGKGILDLSVMWRINGRLWLFICVELVLAKIHDNRTFWILTVLWSTHGRSCKLDSYWTLMSLFLIMRTGVQTSSYWTYLHSIYLINPLFRPWIPDIRLAKEDVKRAVCCQCWLGFLDWIGNIDMLLINAFNHVQCEPFSPWCYNYLIHGHHKKGNNLTLPCINYLVALSRIWLLWRIVQLYNKRIISLQSSVIVTNVQTCSDLLPPLAAFDLMLQESNES